MLNKEESNQGCIQEMVFHDGTPKGLDVVLKEWGVNTDGLTRSDMVKNSTT